MRLLTTSAKVVFALLFAHFVGGCAVTGIPTSDVIGSGPGFVVRKMPRDASFAELAGRYLKDARLEGEVSRLNPNLDGKAQAGDIVVLPTRPSNIAGVWHDGYQTVPILCYHRFSDKSSKDAMVVSAKNFRRQLAYLKDNGYHVVRLEEVIAFLDGKRILPTKSVAITIDDGYRSVLDVALPILQEFNYPATLFAYTDFIGGGHALSWAQLAELDAGGLIEVQSHSKSHSSLSRGAEEEAASYNARLVAEVDLAQQRLDRRIGKKRDRHFAYPYGDTSLEAVGELRKREFTSALTVQRGGNGSFAPRYLLRRNMIYGGDDLAAFKKSLRVFRKQDLGS